MDMLPQNRLRGVRLMPPGSPVELLREMEEKILGRLEVGVRRPWILRQQRGRAEQGSRGAEQSRAQGCGAESRVAVKQSREVRKWSGIGPRVVVQPMHFGGLPRQKGAQIPGCLACCLTASLPAGCPATLSQQPSCLPVHIFAPSSS